MPRCGGHNGLWRWLAFSFDVVMFVGVSGDGVK